MNNSIYKSNGKMRGERLTVKAFKNSDDMHRFLNKQSDNNWKEHNGSVAGAALATKTGKYAFAGGAWHNVKHLDVGMLAHI